MRMIPDQLRSKNLVPFKKRHGRYKIPGMTSENEVLMNPFDPDLSPEEQSYVRHYLGYADAFIKMTEESALAELGEAGLPESALPTPADQPAKSLVDESSSAKNDPAKAA
jgi:hypothetical protein